MSPVGCVFLLVAVVAGCYPGLAQRSAHVAPSLEERAALRRGPCAIGWTLSDDRCFRISPVAAAWDEARRLCSQQRPAARLASALTRDDQELVTALWREAVRTQPAARRQEAALWIDPAAGLERSKAAQRGGYGALKPIPLIAYNGPEAVEAASDAAAVVVAAGDELSQPIEPLCPSLAADVVSARRTGHRCGQELLYVCELDTADLNTTEEEA